MKWGLILIPAFRPKRIKWSPLRNVLIKCKAPTTILVYAVKQCYVVKEKKNLILYLNYDIDCHAIFMKTQKSI